jgi:hypothetical protein
MSGPRELLGSCPSTLDTIGEAVEVLVVGVDESPELLAFAEHRCAVPPDVRDEAVAAAHPPLRNFALATS